LFHGHVLEPTEPEKVVLPAKAAAREETLTRFSNLYGRCAQRPPMNAFKESKRWAEWRQNTRPWLRPPYGVARQRSRGSFRPDIA
jgi:hypothetical protein